ncbi:N-terminal region of Chorein a TM vesicle-mediated sorter [Cryptosporidium hominis]|nr:N-terminal region of Chorein a TM vesicle-mediated sorter [Cryptosporidium hominis]
MLETILQRLLGRYLEPYVYNLSRENLRLGVLSGNLVLENLKLKENLGDILHLPLSIVSGQIGHVSITIPWTSLGYKPLVIKLKELHVVVRPKDYGNVDEDTLRKELREAKEKLIEFKERRLNERFLNGELSNSSNNPNEVPESVGHLSKDERKDLNGVKDSKSIGGSDDANNSANGTNLLWRIIKKIVANVQLEIQDIHICMVGFQSSDDKLVVNHSRNTRSDIIMGAMIKSGFVVTTDSLGNRDTSSLSSESQKLDDPNALYKTIEINEVGIYIGQYFPNTFNFNSESSIGNHHRNHNHRNSHPHSHQSPSNSPNKIKNDKASYEMVNIVNVRNKLLETSDEKSMNDKKTVQTLESKYLLIYDENDSHKSLGAWRLEYILKPLTFHLNISHSPVNNELKGILQVHSITEHTIILRRSHLRPIIFSLQSLNERQEKYREILMKNSHLVNLDPISLKTTTQDEYISLYSRKLRLEAIRLYNNEGDEANFFGVVVQPLNEEELTRLQILDDVLSVRHITKWRCKAKEAIIGLLLKHHPERN